MKPHIALPSLISLFSTIPLSTYLIIYWHFPLDIHSHTHTHTTHTRTRTHTRVCVRSNISPLEKRLPALLAAWPRQSKHSGSWVNTEGYVGWNLWKKETIKNVTQAGCWWITLPAPQHAAGCTTHSIYFHNESQFMWHTKLKDIMDCTNQHSIYASSIDCTNQQCVYASRERTLTKHVTVPHTNRLY
jgi:hypothetical protein